MAQEFTINSPSIESKINSLLPSQGGFGAGIDFSASTMVIPIVDLTESAEGSGLREDLQKSLSLVSISSFDVSGSTTTLINTTGYFRVFGNYTGQSSSTTNRTANFTLTDGTTSKIIMSYEFFADATSNVHVANYDFIVFLQAGDSLTASTNAFANSLVGSTRQIADITGNLVNP